MNEVPNMIADAGYRLNVVAAGVVDVVAGAGGWLYDRRAAGWEVTVFVPDLRDTRALRVLGVRACALNASTLAGDVEGHELAVSATAFADDTAVREVLSRALGQARVGATLWGEGWPMPIARAVHPVAHPLSAAALAFKKQALAAAGLASDTCESRESFVTDLRLHASADSDLIPVARSGVR